MHIFLSYAKTDATNLALEIAEKLSSHSDISVWIDEKTTLSPIWMRQLEVEIERCDLMIVLISPDVYETSDNLEQNNSVLHEITYAQSQRKFIFPVLIKETLIPSEILALEYLDLTSNFKQGTKQLVRKINQLAARDDLQTLALEQALVCAKSEIDGLKIANAELSARLEQLQQIQPIFEGLILLSYALRMPLNSIIGFSRVLLKENDGPLTEIQKQDVQTILDCGKRTSDLLNSIFDYVKIEVNKIEILLTYFNVQLVVETVMEWAEKEFTKPGVHFIAEANKNIKFVVEVDEYIPQGYGDEYRTRQILFQLVSNALKFTEQGSITVRARLIDNQHQPYVEISVEDTGVGIASEHYPIIFEPFKSVSGYDTGLGLYLAKSLANLQNGDIWFESEFGKGTTFYISIPVNPIEDS